MPYQLGWEPLGVVHRFSGVVSDEDLMAATEEVNASPLLPTSVLPYCEDTSGWPNSTPA